MNASIPRGLEISTSEFVALCALLMCLTALSIDIMLPVLPQIAASLDVSNPNDRQRVVTSYLAGLVAGQLFAGPLSDRFGRLPVLQLGLAIFVACSLLASMATSFTWLLIARAMQGFAGAAPRIVVTALVRDLFEGRQMARIMSLVMTVFILVPIFAPAIGQLLAYIGGWRAPFFLLAVAALVALGWAFVRLPETSPGHDKTASTERPGIGLIDAIALVIRTRTSVGYILASGFMFGCLMAYILSSQQLFVDVYNLGAWFPLAFGGIAVAIAVAGIINSRLVVRFGMRYVSHNALIAFLFMAIVQVAASLLSEGHPPFWFLWGGLWLQFLCFGLIVSNFNAIAMEPLGRVAGLGSSIMGSYTTLCSAVLGSLVGQSFDMTTGPISIGFLSFAAACLITVFMTDGALTLSRPKRA